MSSRTPCTLRTPRAACTAYTVLVARSTRNVQLVVYLSSACGGGPALIVQRPLTGWTPSQGS